jgi:hypothetical protein
MKLLAPVLVAAFGVSLLYPATTAMLSASPSPAASASDMFAASTIDTDLTGGYQVVVTDVNRDGRPNLLTVATGLDEIRWCESPGWSTTR